MKLKQLFLFVFGIVILYSCSTESSKEKKSNDPVVKETAKKEVKKEAPYVYGIDISNYQGNEVDFINSKKDSIGFVICKATQGAYGTDPKFAENWPKVKQDEFLRGAYHFYVSTDNPEAQAKHFCSVTKDLRATDLPLVVDFENGGIDNSQPVEEVAKGLILFLNTLEKESGRKPMIYTDIPTADKYLLDKSFASYALWIANYVQKPAPDLPITWQKVGWTFWQRDASYKLDNFTNDSDVFNGDISKLKEFIQNYVLE